MVVGSSGWDWTGVSMARDETGTRCVRPGKEVTDCGFRTESRSETAPDIAGKDCAAELNKPDFDGVRVGIPDPVSLSTDCEDSENHSATNRWSTPSAGPSVILYMRPFAPPLVMFD